jgi:hypothetical protein
MIPNDEAESLRDDAWDDQCFSLILNLSEKNSSRYESQAESLLKHNTFVITVEGVEIRYEITPIGCRYSASENANGVALSGWTRMGWKKSTKRSRLPFFFASSEAGVLLGLSQ